MAETNFNGVAVINDTIRAKSIIINGTIIEATNNEKYSFLTKWGSDGTGDGQFNRPGGIAVDSSGNVYVIESNGGLHFRAQKFSAS